MKNIVFIIIWMLPIIAPAQNSALNDLFEKYSGKDGYTSVYITKYMFNMFKDVENKTEEGDFEKVATKLNFIKILTFDDGANKTAKENFSNDLLSKLPKSSYKEIMVIKEGSETIKFLFKEGSNKNSELVMLVSGSDDPVLLFMEGDIKMSDLSKLSKTTNIDGFEHLKKVDEKH